MHTPFARWLGIGLVGLTGLTGCNSFLFPEPQANAPSPVARVTLPPAQSVPLNARAETNVIPRAQPTAVATLLSDSRTASGTSSYHSPFLLASLGQLSSEFLLFFE